MKDKIFIVPQNDLESVEIIKMLKEQGYKEGDDLFITSQQWGASWDGLEPEIKEKLKQLKEDSEKRIEDKRAALPPDTPLTLDTKGTWEIHEWHQHRHYQGGGETDERRYIVEGKYREYLEDETYGGGEWYNGKVKRKSFFMSEREKAIKDFNVFVSENTPKFYGVELKGVPLYEYAENIDHHSYCDKDWGTGEILYEDDRTNPQSSIEQVSCIINVPLSIEQKFISANDKGFVDAMKTLGENMKMDRELMSTLIKETRMKEHAILAEIQGITPEMEQQAEEGIKNAQILENGIMIVNLPHSKCATVTDRIPEQEYNGGLLIVCGDGEIDYYGPSSTVDKLQKELSGWTGDLSQSHTFWGISAPENFDKIVNRVVDIASDKNINKENINKENINKENVNKENVNKENVQKEKIEKKESMLDFMKRTMGEIFKSKDSENLGDRD